MTYYNHVAGTTWRHVECFQRLHVQIELKMRSLLFSSLERLGCSLYRDENNKERIKVIFDSGTRETVCYKEVSAT